MGIQKTKSGAWLLALLVFGSRTLWAADFEQDLLKVFTSNEVPDPSGLQAKLPELRPNIVMPYFQDGLPVALQSQLDSVSLLSEGVDYESKELDGNLCDVHESEIAPLQMGNTLQIFSAPKNSGTIFFLLALLQSGNKTAVDRLQALRAKISTEVKHEGVLSSQTGEYGQNSVTTKIITWNLAERTIFLWQHDNASATISVATLWKNNFQQYAQAFKTAHRAAVTAPKIDATFKSPNKKFDVVFHEISRSRASAGSADVQYSVKFAPIDKSFPTIEHSLQLRAAGIGDQPKKLFSELRWSPLSDFVYFPRSRELRSLNPAVKWTLAKPAYERDWVWVANQNFIYVSNQESVEPCGDDIARFNGSTGEISIIKQRECPEGPPVFYKLAKANHSAIAVSVWDEGTSFYSTGAIYHGHRVSCGKIDLHTFSYQPSKCETAQ